MATPIPAGKEGLIPHLVCDPCADAIEFYKKAFGAEEIQRSPAPDGKRIMHTEIRIDGRPVFLVDDFPEYCGGKASSPKALGGTPVTIHRYVKDCDAAIKRAQEAGATVKMPAADMFGVTAMASSSITLVIRGHSRPTSRTLLRKKWQKRCKQRLPSIDRKGPLR